LQGTFSRRFLVVEHQTNQNSTPLGMVSAQVDGLLDEPLRLGRASLTAVFVRGAKAIGTAFPETAQQMPHGAWSEIEFLGQGRDGTTLTGTVPKSLPHGDRNGSWHDNNPP
jgi:hypothetical protein